MSRSLLGGREHQITHANVDIELNSFNTRESKAQIAQIDLTGLIGKKINCDISNTLNGLHSFRIRVFFVEFDTLHLEIFVICWIESVYPVDDLRMTNQIYLFIVMSQYTNSHAETPFGISSIYVILTISYLRAQTIETSSLPTDSSRPLFEQIEIFSIY